MKNEKQLNIEYIDIDKVLMYENNAKKHPDEQIKDIVTSIKKYGMNDPIAVWKDNVIIEGHGRLMACKQLGFRRVPVIRLDSLTDQERREYMIVHNQTNMETEWDFDKLEEELNGLDFKGFDFGFDFSRLDGMAEQMSAPEPVFSQNGVNNVVPEGGIDPYLPEGYDDSEIEEYTQNQENYIAKRRIIITYLPEQESKLAHGLHLEEIDKVVYDIDELFT